jgi:sulfite reductase beta subunit-like hemoprotein
MSKNKVEVYKKEKHPYDIDLINRLKMYTKHEKIPLDDRDIGLKWYGIFYRKATPGYFMVRVRITHGKLDLEQAKVIAYLSKEFGRNEVDITSRQQIQLRWVELKNIFTILESIQKIGLTTLQTGMDNVRNITGYPLSGLTEESIIDTIPIAKKIEDIFIGKKEFANLPRKFNPSLLGAKVDSINCKYNDLCFYLAIKEGVYGFNVYAGGKIGSGGPALASNLNMFVQPHEVVDISKTILQIYSELGNREDRNKNRLYFLINELGINGFRNEIVKRLNKDFPEAGDELVENFEEQTGIIRQKNGLYAVSIIVPAGIFSGNDLERVAYLAETYGNGEIRFSAYQNIYIVNVPEEKLDKLLSDEIFKKYKVSDSHYFNNLMACQGSKTCSFGVIENKPDAIKLANFLSKNLPINKPLKMHWSGCIKGCGQHGAGDLGFVGTKVKINGVVKLAVDVFLKEEKIGTVPLDELEGFVEKLILDKVL